MRFTPAVVAAIEAILIDECVSLDFTSANPDPNDAGDNVEVVTLWAPWVKNSDRETNYFGKTLEQCMLKIFMDAPDDIQKRWGGKK